MGPSPVDKSDKEVNISTDLFAPPLVGKPNKEANVSTDQIVSSPVDKLDKEADKEINLFRYFIKNLL